MRKTLVVLAAIVAMLVAYAGAALAQATPPVSYTVTDLGDAGSSSISFSDINDSGQISGTFWFDGQPLPHAALYEHGLWKDLGTPGAGYSTANALSNSGLVVGTTTAFDDGGNYRAFLYENGTMKNLATSPTSPHSFAYGVNDAGQVVGDVTSSNG